MYNLFLSISIFCLFTSCKQTTYKNDLSNNQIFDIDDVTIKNFNVSKKVLKLIPKEGRWYYNKIPFNGYAVKYHPNGNIIERIGYYDGKKYGVAKTWYPNGLLRKQFFYYSNKLTGNLKMWSKDTVLIKNANYVKGAEHGIQKIWHRNGQLARLRNTEHGKEVGIQKAWLDNGKIYVNYEAKNGRTFGMKRANLCFSLEDEIAQTKKK